MKKRYEVLDASYYALYYIKTNTLIYNITFKGNSRVIQLVI